MEALIESERLKAIHESICGFLLDEVINPNGEFYADPRISVGRVDPNKDISDEEAESYTNLSNKTCK